MSDGGNLHTCKKSHLAAVLESHVTLPDNEPHDDVFIIDGSALVDILPPRTSNTFEDYATLDVLPTIRAYSIKYERTYIVFDEYRPSSLNSEARSKRGHGARCKGHSNWRNFLRDNDNKTDLLHFLADKIEQMLLRYNIYCISIVNTNQAQLMIVYKASNVCILLTFVSAIL